MIKCVCLCPPLWIMHHLDSSHLGHGGLDAGCVVGAGAGGAVDEPGLGLLVAAHQAVVRARRLVDTLIAVPATRDEFCKCGILYVWKILNIWQPTYQSPSGMMVMAGLKQYV